MAWTQKSVLNKASSDSQIDKPQRGCPKRAELPDININTGAQSINTERAFLRYQNLFKRLIVLWKVTSDLIWYWNPPATFRAPYSLLLIIDMVKLFWLNRKIRYFVPQNVPKGDNVFGLCVTVPSFSTTLHNITTLQQQCNITRDSGTNRQTKWRMTRNAGVGSGGLWFG